MVGFAKLFLADICVFPPVLIISFDPYRDIVMSAQLFKKLVILFFCPSTLEDIELRQCLSVFFPAFAFSNPNSHANIIESAVIPVLKTVSRGFLLSHLLLFKQISTASTSSLVKKIPLQQVTQFLFALLNDYRGNTEESSDKKENVDHTKIAIELAHEILANPRGSKELCKLMSLFQISAKDQELVKTLKFLIGEIIENGAVQKDKLVSKAITKFADSIERVDKYPDAPLSPTKAESLREKTKRMAEADVSDDGADVPSTKGKKKQTQRKPQPKRTRNVVRKHISDSESSAEESEEDDVEDVAPVKTPVRAPSTRQVAQLLPR